MRTTFSCFLPFLTSLSPNTLSTYALAHYQHFLAPLSLTSYSLTLSSYLQFPIGPKAHIPYHTPYHSHKITCSAAGKGLVTTHIIGNRESFITVALGLEVIRAIPFVGHSPVCFSHSFITVLYISQGTHWDISQVIKYMH